MQFERRVFGYYERVIGNCTATGTQGTRVCLTLLLLLLGVTVANFAILVSAHSAYIHRTGCFESALTALCANGTAECYRSTDVFRVRIEDVVTAVVGSRGFTQPSPVDPAANFEPDYVFSGTREGVTLALSHTANPFRVLNFTLTKEACLGASGADAVISVGLLAYDTIMVNDAMRAFPQRSGYIANVYTREPWNWGPLETNTWDLKVSNRGWESFLYRLGVLLESVFLFFLISSMSALLVRVTASSLPALMYPFVGLLSRAFVQDRIFDERNVSRAFPWLGQHVRALQAFGTSHTPFVLANFAWFFFTFFVTLSAVVYTEFLYHASKSLPYGMVVSIWSVFLLAELFSFLFVRSAWSIFVFPRLFFAAFLVTQAYIFAFPYAFFSAAVDLFFNVTLLIMLCCLFFFEMPAFASGDISRDKPRAFMVQVGAAATPTDLPQAWSLFMQLNSRLVTIPDGEASEDSAPPPREALGVPQNSSMVMQQQQQLQQQHERDFGNRAATSALLVDGAGGSAPSRPSASSSKGGIAAANAAAVPSRRVSTAPIPFGGAVAPADVEWAARGQNSAGSAAAASAAARVPLL